MHATSSGLAFGWASDLRTATLQARHQSKGSCSAHPFCGEANAWCSSVPEETTTPHSSISSARVPLVPTSIPRKYWMVGLLEIDCKPAAQRAAGCCRTELARSLKHNRRTQTIFSSPGPLSRGVLILICRANECGVQIEWGRMPFFRTGKLLGGARARIING